MKGPKEIMMNREVVVKQYIDTNKYCIQDDLHLLSETISVDFFYFN